MEKGGGELSHNTGKNTAIRTKNRHHIEIQHIATAKMQEAATMIAKIMHKSMKTLLNIYQYEFIERISCKIGA